MGFRSIAAAAACCSVLVLAQWAPAFADGMPEPEDENYNPVPSVPGVPAPGMKQPAPIREPKPVKPAAPVSAPAPAPAPSANAPAVPAAPATAPVATPAVPVAPSVPAAPATPVTPPPPAPTPTPAVPAVTAPAVPAVPAAAPAVPKVTAAAGLRTVYEVLSIDVQFPDKNPSAATLIVKGTARTGGWKDVQLRPLQTFAPEPGMRSFTLVGLPPTGMATQALTPVTVTTRIDPLPADVRTIRVLAETNEVAQRFR